MSRVSGTDDAGRIILRNTFGRLTGVETLPLACFGCVPEGSEARLAVVAGRSVQTQRSHQRRVSFGVEFLLTVIGCDHAIRRAGLGSHRSTVVDSIFEYRHGIRRAGRGRHGFNLVDTAFPCRHGNRMAGCGRHGSNLVDSVFGCRHRNRMAGRGLHDSDLVDTVFPCRQGFGRQIVEATGLRKSSTDCFPCEHGNRTLES
ncbi:hypothetical protein AVEN_247139-1 [Araneus ventricosus]|uniref:Uncharacterized protein n=1 Tax=Araneus ventricosus TaxID=182803 RepID=A0A4Y2URK8_ARAVE|nr:hypothetical protein AVEN_247139-1 [Araneus ventricosus]